jgi:thiol-disulfide isomerase/thioredoxin
MTIKKSLLLSLFATLLLCMCSVGYAANSFVLKDMAGKKHTLSEYKGKWVVVNYWATWCPPCLEEVPDLVALYDSRKNKDLMILGVAFDYENAKEVTDYVNDMLISYPIVLGDEEVQKQIGFSDVLPTSYIYNPKGELIKIKHGLVTKQYLESIMPRAK